MDYFALPHLAILVGFVIGLVIWKKKLRPKQEPSVKPKNISDSIKDIKVIVNNNPGKTSRDCYSGTDPCFVLNISGKSLSLMENNVEYILINGIKIGTVKSEPLEQKIIIEYTDGTSDGFTNSAEAFAFSHVMKWYHSKESNEYRFDHKDGFTTFRRDLIKQIKFRRIKPQQLNTSTSKDY